MDPRHLFSAADQEAIRAAVEAAETRSAGEVVPWVTDACDPYPEASWKAAALGTLAGLALGWVVHQTTGVWGGGLAYLGLPALAMAAAGFLLGRLRLVKRLLAEEHVVAHRVRTAAESAFLRGDVFATRERVGILVFLALLERRVVVLGDAAINARVRPEEWQDIADRIVAGIRRGKPAEALASGIEACGQLLADRGMTRTADDVDELPDQLHFEGH